MDITMKARYGSLILIALALLLALPQAGQVAVVVAAPPPYLVYLPLVQKDPFSCATGESYGSFAPAGSDSTGSGIPAASHPDKNLDVRGYVLDSGGGLGYMSLDLRIMAHDPSAPQLTTLFSPTPAPPFAHVYKVYGWNWPPPNGTGSPPYGSRGSLLGDTLLGITTTIGTAIRLPVRMNGDYPVAQIGGTKYYGLVVYAAADQITIVYISKDSIVNNSGQGYGLHVKNVCVDPTLLTLYNNLNAAGRGQLPALRYNQAFGVANGPEVDVAMVDSGNFMDPRSRVDWWVP
jgi:hypothetical protein